MFALLFAFVFDPHDAISGSIFSLTGGLDERTMLIFDERNLCHNPDSNDTNTGITTVDIPVSSTSQPDANDIR